MQWEHEMIKENPDYDNPKILVDISVKTLYLLNDNELIKTYPIASGKLSTPSPLGSWTVISKARWSGGFGTRWMGLNAPWGNCQETHFLCNLLALENRRRIFVNQDKMIAEKSNLYFWPLTATYYRNSKLMV
ncbi:MAG: L,D-transpeptidase [Clostridiaceae bacterium]|nr:L,D-transpeptidase [Clostridiaceae bacterium]